MRKISLAVWFGVFLCMTAAHAAVEIPTDISYGQDVEAWWGQHVFNPESPNYDPDIISPANQVSLNSGQSINGAIAGLPASGGTIILNPGTYSAFEISKRSNIHIIAPSGATITGSSRLEGTTLSYHDFVVAIRVNRDASAVDDFENKKTRNIYVKGVTFDGGGSTIYAMVSDCVEGVLFEDCVYQNYARHPTVPNHVGMTIGSMGTDNIWYRGCTFKCYATSKPGNAIYHDGIHAGGTIDCTVETGFSWSGFLYLNNDDYTYDHNRNGVYEDIDIRMSRFVVTYDCRFNNIRTATRITGADCLVMNCTGTGSFGQAFCYFNPKSSQIYENNTYMYYGHRVIGNVVDGGGALAEFHQGDDYVNPAWDNKAHLGRYGIRGNKTSSMSVLVRETGEVDGPNIICGNSFNDPSVIPDPNCPHAASTRIWTKF